VKHRKILEEIGFALLCLALTLSFFHEVTFHRTATFVHGFDNTYQYYPWMHKLASDWRHLSAPLWDFSVEAGFPFAGEIQTGAFYPVNILYVWLSGVPMPPKLDFLILLHFAGGMWGMTLFLRHRGINRCASLFGGAVFFLVGPVAAQAAAQANIFAGMAYLPWVLYFFERAISSDRPLLQNAPAGLCGLTLAFSLLAGHPQPFIHNGLMLVMFAIYLFLERRTNAGPWETSLLHFLAIFAIVAAVCFLFTFVQLAAGQEYFARAYRWVGLPSPIKAMDVVPFAAYNLYKLSPPGLLSIFNLRFAPWPVGTLFLTITALVCACLGMGFPGRLRWFAVIIAAFSLVVALANSTPIGSLIYYVPVLNRVREPLRIVYLYQFCVATLAGAGLHVATKAIPRWRSRAVLSLTVITVFVFEAHWNGAQVLRSINDAMSASQAYRRTPLIRRLESENSSGPTPCRILARPKELIPPNSGDVFHLNTVLGYRSSMLISYFDFLSTDWSVSSPALDQLGARYFLTDEPAAGLPVLATEGNKILYERTSAQPILRLEPHSGGVSSEGISQIVWKRNGVSLRVQAKEPTRLVFAESAFPGWSVRVNGARAALGQNGPLMSVWLNAGESEVDWTYRPWWFVPGMLGWLIGTFFLLSTALPDRWRHLLRWKLRQRPDVHSNAMTQIL
jgi:hypothetical protein